MVIGSRATGERALDAERREGANREMLLMMMGLDQGVVDGFEIR